MTTHSEAAEHFDYQIKAIPERIAILASGGLDSSVMLGAIARSARQVYPVYIRAGLSWEAHELATLRRFVRALHSRNIEPITALKVRTPFAGLTKADVVRRGAGMRLELTVSCARPTGNIHCGACTKCAERVAGFRAAGVADPTIYARKPR